jgi:hypothetical protein
MPLSISKLEKLLSTKGFITNKYFIMHKYCVYIEIMSISNADSFLLYIPSKYKFLAEKESNVYKVKYVDLTKDADNITEDYAGEPDEQDIEKSYEEIDIDINDQETGENIAPHLEENYKRTITLKDIPNDDYKEVKDIYRQLKRFRFCVQNVKYKIGVIYKNFLCSIKRDDSIEILLINRFPQKNCRKLYITVDLEHFYEKMDSLVLNMKTVRQGLFHILDKNHLAHTRILQRLLEQKNSMTDFSENIFIKKETYKKHLQEANSMLLVINEEEKKKLTQIYELNNKYMSDNVKGLYKDIEKSHQISQLNTDLTNIQKIKEDIVKTIFELKEKKENTMLIVDKIMFDNTVMLECILRNFIELAKLC